MNQKLGVVMLSSLMLAACGGGGGGATPTSAPTPAPTPSQSFTPQSPKSGDTYTYAETDTMSDGSTESGTLVKQVALISASGQFYLNSFDAASSDQIGSTLLDKGLSIITNGQCTYTPSRNDMPFPWIVGQNNAQTMTYTCPGSAISATLKTTSQIVSYEPITVPAGTFNTVKSQITVATTATSGSVSQMANENETCWTDVVTGMPVKCTATYTYSPAETGVYNTGFTTQLTSAGNLANAPLLITGNLQASGGSQPLPFVYYTPGENGAMSLSSTSSAPFTLTANNPVTWTAITGTSQITLSGTNNPVNYSGVTLNISTTPTTIQVVPTFPALSTPVTVQLKATLVSDPTKTVIFSLYVQ